MAQKRDLLYWQKKMQFLLWLAYASFYLGRVNLAIALPVMQENLGWTSGQIGFIGSSFFWVYAVGQLVNGHLGDRISAKGLVLSGLIGTALVNFVSSFTSLFGIMLFLWAINGYLQSTGWGPVVKTASNWMPPEKRGTVSAFLGTSIIAGSMLSLFLSSRLLAWYPGQWQLIFRVPALLLLISSLIWAVLAKNRPEDVGLSSLNSGVSITNETSYSKDRKRQLDSILRFFCQPELIVLAVASALQGIVKDGINLWAPTLLVQSQDLAVTQATSHSLWIPPFGFFGVTLAGWLMARFRNNERKVISTLYGMATIVALLGMYIIPMKHYLLTVLTIALCSGLVYGINTLLLTSIPLRFAGVGKESTVAGFLDFASYVGAGFAGVITGLLLQYWEWAQIVGMWGLICAAGGLLMLDNRFEKLLSVNKEKGGVNLKTM